MPAGVATVEIGFFLRLDGRAEVAGGEARGGRVGDASLGKGDFPSWGPSAIPQSFGALPTFCPLTMGLHCFLKREP